MEVEISAMMVVAALRMVEVVGAAGKPRQMSWYLERIGMLMRMVAGMIPALRRGAKLDTVIPIFLQRRLTQASKLPDGEEV